MQTIALHDKHWKMHIDDINNKENKQYSMDRLNFRVSNPKMTEFAFVYGTCFQCKLLVNFYLTILYTTFWPKNLNKITHVYALSTITRPWLVYYIIRAIFHFSYTRKCNHYRNSLRKFIIESNETWFLPKCNIDNSISLNL